MDRWTDVTIPIPLLHPLTIVAAFAVLVLAGAWAMTHGKGISEFAKRTILPKWPEGDLATAKLKRFAILFGYVGTAFFLMSMWRLANLLLFPPETYHGLFGGGGDFRMHYLAFAAVATFTIALVGIPFAVHRFEALERQTKAQEEGLITDRINKAVEGLGAEKTVKRQRLNETGKRVYEKGDDGQPDFSKPVSEEVTVPNLEVRIGAIYALERIAQDSLRDHIQIMEILCAYVRENSSAKNNEEIMNFHYRHEWNEKIKEDRHFSTDYENAISKAQIRFDIQATMEVIGRRSKKQKEKEWEGGVRKYWLDFRKSNLIGLDLSHLDYDFSYARFDGAILHRARCVSSKFCGSVFREAAIHEAEMDGCDFREAQFDNCDLWGSSFGGADLSLARLNGCNLTKCTFNSVDLRGSSLSYSECEESDFGRAIFDKNTSFHNSKLSKSFFYETEIFAKNFTQEQVNQTFGDWTVYLPQNILRPVHWPNENEIENFDFLAEYYWWNESRDNYLAYLKEVRGSAPSLPQGEG